MGATRLVKVINNTTEKILIEDRGIWVPITPNSYIVLSDYISLTEIHKSNDLRRLVSCPLILTPVPTPIPCSPLLIIENETGILTSIQAVAYIDSLVGGIGGSGSGSTGATGITGMTGVDGLAGATGVTGPISDINLEQDYLILNASDIAIKGVTLSYEPQDITNIGLVLVGGSVQVQSLDYDMSFINTKFLTWNGFVLDGILVPGNILVASYMQKNVASNVNYEIEYFVLTVSDLINKFVLITYIPKQSSNVQVDVIGGTRQISGIDFLVDPLNTHKIKWNGLGLESILLVGNILSIAYLRSI